MRRIAILGSTGSIGQNALKVVEHLGDAFEIGYLAAHSNVELMLQQVERYRPQAVALVDGSAASELEGRIGDKAVEVLHGREGVAELAGRDDLDIVLNGIVGSAGLEPTVRAVSAGTTVALSNKESLVMGGALIDRLTSETGAELYPVDSEHSAIWQCLMGESDESVRRIVLTASGGPFRERPVETFESITVEEALSHPNWKMGKKITIDSATLMNKGLEIIEAYWLFHISPEQVDVVIHPQSIIHSMVEMIDGSVKAQLGMPDMKLPIQYALTYPHRAAASWELLDFASVKELSFEAPDTEKFPCLTLAREALVAGGTIPAVLNVANEAAVRLFLEERIPFTQIPIVIKEMIDLHTPISDPTLEDILALEADVWNQVWSGHDAGAAEMA